MGCSRTMPRRPRLVVPDLALHVVQRGVDRQACFLTDADRVFYLEALGKLAERHGCAIHAYVLMTNHVHLLLTPSSTDGPGRLLQAIGRHYVRRFNDRHGRTGTLWEGRFKSCLVGEDAYLLTCHRYIETNPVRAGMVSHPASFAWSSHRANAGYDARAARLLRVHDAVLALGPDAPARAAAYRAMFEATDAAPDIDAIRRMTAGNHALGSSGFAARIAALVGRRTAPGRRGRPSRARADENRY